MDIQHLRVDSLPDPSAYSYSHGVQVGGFLAIAGQCGTGSDGRVVSSDFSDQARRALERVEAVVVAAGGTRHDIVSMTVFITDIRDGRTFTQVRSEFFGHSFPASALVGVSTLMPVGALVEVQAIAFPGASPGS